MLQIENLLSAADLEQVDRLLPQLEFADGKLTASGAAREAKNNLQVSRQAHEAYPGLQQLVGTAIAQHPLVQSAVMPVKILPPVISKYESGMHYGWHTDSPLMGEQFMARVDVSITVFLSDPASYQGGELVIHTPTGYLPYKLKRGDAIIYPTTRLHGVNQVVSGTRLAAVTWMQSAVRSPDQRELLLQLKTAMEPLASGNQASEYLLLQQVYSNLVRMWAEV